MTGNKFPVTGRTKNTLCHRKKVHCAIDMRYTSCDRLSLYSWYRNSYILDISCDKKISSCEKNNFSIDDQNNWLNDIWNYKSIEIDATSNWTGALSKLVPWLCISDQNCCYLQIYVDYCLDNDTFFPLFREKLFPGKLASHEIPNFIPPCLHVRNMIL